ncbi:MAG: hypothetical protein HYS62_01550 [Candidatus Aenigmarchaeota archaeon]|nr:hypothetical protein [Candidatus Aenigmarchaeota archaeon]
MKEFILTFDMPRELTRVRKKVHRDLIKIDSKKFQQSLWKSRDLRSLIEIATFIKKSGGSASILEEKLVF